MSRFQRHKRRPGCHRQPGLTHFVTALLAVIVLSQGPGCSSKPPLVPEQIAGLHRVSLTSGEAARQIVDRMHGKDVTPSENYIAQYEGEGGRKGTLYCSVYADEAKAERVRKLMRDLIGKGESPFRASQAFLVEGTEVSRCEGLGEYHCFFATGRLLYWTAAPQGDAARMAQEIIDRLRRR
ncbi:MAG: hypothetical protein AB1428_06905 [Bacteroidota bacterium]